MKETQEFMGLNPSQQRLWQIELCITVLNFKIVKYRHSGTTNLSDIRRRDARWPPPLERGLKLNVDARIMGIGVVIRNYRGEVSETLSKKNFGLFSTKVAEANPLGLSLV